MIHIAMTNLMTHRLTSENTISRRNPTVETNTRFLDRTPREDDHSGAAARVQIRFGRTRTQ